ncbi:MAG: hypothetical protein ACFFFK_05240 [Candidatus Thorarchaeota archaeon]
MSSWTLGKFSVYVELGKIDDSNMDLVVKTKDVTLGSMEATFTVKEGSNAADVLYWPRISLSNPDRRSEIYSAAIEALEKAIDKKAQRVGFFTMGLEVSRIPSWEVAEEIVKAILKHSKTESNLDSISLVASSPIQVSSFQFALNNIPTIVRE